MLKVKNLNVHYGVIHAIHDVSFDVKQGEIVALIGANGAGKTSIMHAISGLLKPTSGEIDFLDENIMKIPAHQIISKKLAQVPEGRRIFAQLTVEENLELGAYLRTDNKVAEDMEQVYKRFPRLKERQNQFAGTLSGGEQQMLAMGRALMSHPKIILMDEPFGAVDGITRIHLQKMIKEIHKNTNVTILFVTHDITEAFVLGTKVLIMDKGRIEQYDTPKNIKSNPKTEFVKLLIGE